MGIMRWSVGKSQVKYNPFLRATHLWKIQRLPASDGTVYERKGRYNELCFFWWGKAALWGGRGKRDDGVWCTGAVAEAMVDKVLGCRAVIVQIVQCSALASLSSTF